MADVIRWATKVTPIEECDEGFKHVHSDVGKSLVGSGEVTITSALKYQSDYRISSAADPAHRPFGGSGDVELLYLKNLGKDGIDISNGVIGGTWVGSATYSDSDSIFQLSSGESILVRPTRGTSQPTSTQIYVWLISGDAVDIEILADAP